jgi:hypothetical protein
VRAEPGKQKQGIGELLKLGIAVGETSVSKYMIRTRKPPSQTWRTFLENHAKTLVYVFLVLAHDRRRILHFAVTAHPTAEWTRAATPRSLSLGHRTPLFAPRSGPDLRARSRGPN